MKSFNTSYVGEAESDALVVHLVASGVVQLAERTAGGEAVRLPYPAPLQRGLDRLTALCFRRRTEPPASVPDLLDWCRRPLASWPLQLPDGATGHADRLLHGALPTQVCQEWAVEQGDVEAEVLERRLLSDVLATCRAADAPSAYTAFRRLLIERPVLTALEWQQCAADPVLSLLGDALRKAYAPAPGECLVDGRSVACATCGNLLVRGQGDELVCAEDRCARGAVAVGREYRAREGVLWLARELRTFVAAPGRAEVRLAADVEAQGAQVELWPAYDAYDLRIVFPDGGAWAVDVKDWANPFLLARRVRPIPPAPPWERAFFVFPQDRLRRPDYLRAFQHYCPLLGGVPATEGAMERPFLARVARRVRRVERRQRDA